MPLVEKTEAVDKKRKRATETPSTPVNETTDYINRFKNTSFITLPKPAPVDDDSDLDADDLLDLLETDDQAETEALILKRKLLREKDKLKALVTDEEKKAALAGQTDHFFHATVMCASQPVIVAGGTCANLHPTRKPKMEDRYDVAKLSGVSHLDDTDLLSIAHDTVSELQAQCVDKKIYGGSTYLNVVIDLAKQKIITTQLGDCEAWLHWIDIENQHHVIALHNAKHNPCDPRERQRLHDAGHSTYPDPRNTKVIRIGSAEKGLAVSRALGDDFLTAAGLLHTPDVHIRSYAKIAREATTIQVILGTDGLHLPSEHVNAAALQSMLADPLNQTTTLLLAKKMLMATAGKGDNAALLIANLPNKPITIPDIAVCDSALSLTMCDGHGTHLIADKIVKLHYEIQQASINYYLQKNKPSVRIKDLSNEPLDTMTTVVEPPMHTASTSTLWKRSKEVVIQEDGTGISQELNKPPGSDC